jgi:signal transduction histidine kinase
MINNVRRYSHALRPIYLEESALDAALDKLAHESNETGIRMHPPCEVKFDPGSLTRPINNDVKLTMFRIAQEAITNALKHSRANTVRLILEEVGTSGVRLTVEDDGRGFDKEAVRDGLGLVNIRERAAMIEARVVMETAPGAGTRIQVTLP